MQLRLGQYFVNHDPHRTVSTREKTMLAFAIALVGTIIAYGDSIKPW
jgi:hypothetical protein